MEAKKRTRLEAHGWRVGSAEDFLDLTPDESVYIDLRIKLSDSVRQLRSGARRLAP
jgi:hypothetical protein